MLDHEIIRRFDLLKPSRAVYESAYRRGFWMMVLAYLVIGMIMSGADFQPVVTLLMPVLIGIASAAFRIHAAHTVLSPSQRSRLERQLALVKRQKALFAAGNAAREDIRSCQAARQKLEELTARMQRLDAGGFGERIAELAEARAHWEGRIWADERLIAGYDHECQMLAIEIDALDEPDIIPTDASPLEAKMAELEELRKIASERQRRRAAELEVSEVLN
jgi:hypothetical protein